jgi:threonine/homoserine/homoserine lactone efflux protein
MSSLIALALATALLVMIPGPNVALIVANSLRYGFREGAVTVLGTTLGVTLQLALVIAGVAALIEYAAEAFAWLRWGGVAYLVFLGIRAWREPAPPLDEVEARPTVFWRACIVAAINPKTLLFNAAYIPQFLPTGAGTLELMLTVAVFLSVLLVGDLLWAAFATSARRLLHRYGRLRNRLTGAFLVAAGVGLALSRRQL